MMKKKSDIKEILSQKTSKATVEYLSKIVINSDDSLKELYSLTTDEDRIVSWHALWTCCKISETDPSFFDNKYNELVHRAMNTEDSGKLRLILNILYHLHQPENINVQFLDFCIENMTALNRTSACQAICMKLAYNLAYNQEPEILREIKLIVDSMDETYYSAAAISAKRFILKKIDKRLKTYRS